eukprot:GFUD01037952.1.p1 GENE.GFUD01037952.1~~GFUD01037952.1.p1  ORF type:complete len:514 (+),score=98.80 GFUD01037952.1:159-1700(+)
MWQFLLLIVPSVSAANSCESLQYDTLCLMDISNTIALIPDIKNEVDCQAECGHVRDCSHFSFFNASYEAVQTSKVSVVSDSIIDQILPAAPTTTSCALVRSCNSKSSQSCSGLPNCNLAVSGPRSPKITEMCCQEFGKKACKGEIIAQHFKVSGPEECQKICQQTPHCQYYTQYSGDACFLHRSCDKTEPCSICTSGPASPSRDQCQKNSDHVTLLIGGTTSTGGSYSTNMELVTEDLSCTPDMPEPPVGRRNAAAVLLGRSILYCGGHGNTAPTYHSDCYSYLLGKSGENWQAAASMNHPRSLFSIEVIQGQAFAIGGTSDLGSSVTGYTVEIYTPGQGWVVSEAMRMPGYRYGHCSVTINSRLIVIGGIYAGASYSTGVIQFDLTAPKKGWTNLHSTTYGRQDHACQSASFQGQEGIFVTGGSNSGNTLVEFYVDSLNRWRTLPPMSSNRYYFTSSIIGHNLHVHGGEGGQATQEMFNTTWTSGTNLRISRKRHSSVSLPQDILSCDGLDN